MQRIQVIQQHLRQSYGEEGEGNYGQRLLTLEWTANGRKVRIGDVELLMELPIPGREHLVPVGYLNNGREQESQETLRVLRFMMQKYALAQDIYLIGPPGPLRRELAMKFCELCYKQVEYVPLSQDTTESDLKQRREISSGTALYVDGPAVRAAIMGSVLILDGIEKAERNVMPLLNNLLENREMALEDGRFLVNPKRFDALLQEHSVDELEAWKLVRTSDQFRVIALGLPIPRYPGNTLDPPFRSRFQARDVQNTTINNQLMRILDLAPNGNEIVQKSLVSAAGVISDLRNADGSTSTPTSMPEFPQNFEDYAGNLWRNFPFLSAGDVSEFFFPFLNLLTTSSDDRLHVIRKVFRRFGLFPKPLTGQKDDGFGDTSEDFAIGLAESPIGTYKVDQVIDFSATRSLRVSFSFEPNLNEKSLEKGSATFAILPAGEVAPSTPNQFVMTPTNERIFSKMCQAHSIGDFCLIGEKGGGKTAFVNYFARRLGYHVEHIPLYKDLSARALLQRRTTHPNGDTDWEDSNLIVAALHGRLAVLDGVEQLAPGILSTLQQLVSERYCCLPDGSRLIGYDKFLEIMKRDKISEKELREVRNIRPIHPSFRVIALARPTGGSASSSSLVGSGWKDWLTAEVQSMFRFVFIHPMSVEEQRLVLSRVAPGTTESTLDHLMLFSSKLREAINKDDMLSALQATVSMRQMIRICRRLTASLNLGCSESDLILALREAILGAALSRFLPPVVLATLHKLLDESGLPRPISKLSENPEDIVMEVINVKDDPKRIGELKIGNVSVDILKPKDPLLVPDILFYDNPRQTMMMMEMLKDWKCGQHLLLIGNQGVGKNKMADRMLQLLQLPREYIQLHRDTTVQNLTSNPTIVNGVLQYEDSPLVRAARDGRVLVVDEADKAPTYVTAVLKALVEDRSMLLADGRRIVDPEEMKGFPEGDREHILLHPDFRVISLANRPGFPFHGNDFFREVGDVFACHAIDNPDAESEMQLLMKYGPDVPLDTLRKLVNAFDGLRALSDDGQLSYPYSTRELAAIVKHMQRFPSDGIEKILRNVFDFDNYSDEERDILVGVFAKNGVPFSMGSSAFQVTTGHSYRLDAPRMIERWITIPFLNNQESLFKISNIQYHSMRTVMRLNQGNTSDDRYWNFRPMTSELRIARKERHGGLFSEELYNFHFPQSAVSGLCVLPDGTVLLTARSSSFMLNILSPDHVHCRVYDVHGALPADGTYRAAPKLTTMIPLINLSEHVILLSPDRGEIFAIDLLKMRLMYIHKLSFYDASGSSFPLYMVTLNTNEVFVYQSLSKKCGILNFELQTVCELDLPFVISNAFQVGNGELMISSILSSNTNQIETLYHVDYHASGANLNIRKVQKQVAPNPDMLRPDVIIKPAAPSSAYFSDPPSSIAGRTEDKAALNLQTKTIVDSISNTNISKPFGALQTNSRFLHLQSQNAQEKIAAFALNLPQGLKNGGPVHIYQVATRVENEAPKRLQTGDSRAVHLRKSDLLAISHESPDVYEVDVELFSLDRENVRILSINLQDDDLLGQGKSSAAVSLSSNSSGNKMRNSPMPLSSLTPDQLKGFTMRRHSFMDAPQRLFLYELPDGNLLTVTCLGWARVWLVDELAVRRAFADWRKFIGQSDDEPLRIIRENGEEEGDGDGQGKGKGNGKGEGEGDGEGDGDGQGQGAGQGGGSGKLSQKGGGSASGRAQGKSFDEISELPDPGQYDGVAIENPASMERKEREEEPTEVKEAAAKLKAEQWKGYLKSMDMTELDMTKYTRYKEAVKTEIRELRVVLEGLEAKEKERVWLKNQTTGDLDDTKLIDGLTGERAIYKKRSDQDPNSAFFQPLPKRMHFLFDLSMSMSRYAADGRLERSLETAVMVMEALRSFEHKFLLKMSGHSGDTDNFILVDWNKTPKNDKERLMVIKQMFAHTEVCGSGDNTMEATKRAILEITREPADDYFVFLISDANLDQYGITPAHLSKLYSTDPRVHLFTIFIASKGSETKQFEDLIPGKVFTCLDKGQLPKTLKMTFLQAALE